MRYTLQVLINRLDGTKEENISELGTREKLLDSISHELCKHEDFASSFVITVVCARF
jgi:hypothetical protein